MTRRGRPRFKDNDDARLRDVLEGRVRLIIFLVAFVTALVVGLRSTPCGSLLTNEAKVCYHWGLALWIALPGIALGLVFGLVRRLRR